MGYPIVFEKTKYNKGFAIALLSALIISTSAVLIRHLTETYQLPALVLAFWRALFVVLVLGIVFLFRYPQCFRTPIRNMRFLVGYSLVQAVFNALWILSVDFSGASVATVLVYSSAGFTALLGYHFFEEKIGKYKLLTILISVFGCVLVMDVNSSSWNESLPGLGLGILSGLFFAVYTILGREASLRGISPWTTIFYIYLGSAFFLFAFNLGSGGVIYGSGNFFWLGTSWEGWAILLLLAAGPSALGFGLYNTSLKYLPSSIVNLINTSEPVFTVLIAYVFLNEHLSPIQFSGCFMIVFGITLLRIGEIKIRRKSRP